MLSQQINPEISKNSSDFASVLPNVLDLDRLLTSLVGLAELFRASLEMRKQIGDLTVVDLMKYILTAYVKESTGRYHDAEVSAIIGAKLDVPDYDENSQKSWRSRSLARLEKAFHGLLRVPCILGTILSENK